MKCQEWTADGVATLIREIQPQLPIILFSGDPDIPASTLQAFAGVVLKGDSTDLLLTALARLIHQAPASQKLLVHLQSSQEEDKRQQYLVRSPPCLPG